MRKLSLSTILALAPAVLGTALTAAASQSPQMPLAPVRSSGQTVTPAYEGWYENADGSYTLSFGYYNRNTEEVLDIPLGDDNFIEPAMYDGVQPTHFPPRRHWGVFGVRVPADFGDGRVVWTLEIRGQTFSVPGHLKPEWKIDALAGEAGAGNTPPVLKFDARGPEGAGPGGIIGDELTTRVGVPLEITVWAADDGRPDTSVASGGRPDVPVTLTWWEHQGPGTVTFNEDSARVPVSGGSMTTAATFDRPGEYVLRVRANDASGVDGAGHAQCCWSNGFVKVTVTR
ncbi:MAG: hypothetical protein PVJ49_10445 [Acidobacteriota bacterium]|jgi:hypothetical protein